MTDFKNHPGICMNGRLTTVVMLLWGMFGPLFAQENIVREQTGNSAIQFEQHYIAQDTTNSVIIPFRIRYDYFVFTRAFSSVAEMYSAHGEVTVELLDSTGTSVARSIQQIGITVKENLPSSLREQFTQNFFIFYVPNGRYSIVFKVEDKESKRQFVDDKKRLTISKPDSMLSGLIPVKNESEKKFTLFNLGGDVLFSQNYGFVFLSQKRYASATSSLLKLQLDDEEKEVINANAPSSITVFENRTITAMMENSTTLPLHGMNRSNIHYVAFDGSQLSQGRYELTLTFPDSTKLKTTFAARWQDMPVSLNDLDLATEPIQFITTKSDYSDLRKGGRETRIKRFEEFWKKKDTTPLTAYNEVMHEFYRRVDFSMTAFRTLRDMNGAITDRGKIYLLFGKPSTTERLLNPDGAPKEIWKYNSLNKTFTFEDPSKQGNYKLAENK
jgi:GWxTD domain-containing protein